MDESRSLAFFFWMSCKIFIQIALCGSHKPSFASLFWVRTGYRLLITRHIWLLLTETGPRWADADRISLIAQEDVQFSIWVSFFEIYNELIYDLLDTNALGLNRKRTALRLCEDQTGNPYVKGRQQPICPVHNLKSASYWSWINHDINNMGCVEARVTWAAYTKLHFCWAAKFLQWGATVHIPQRYIVWAMGFQLLHLSLLFPDLNWINVQNADEAWRLLKLGQRKQSFASTHMNQNSSRRSVVESVGRGGSGVLLVYQAPFSFIPSCSLQSQHLLHSNSTPARGSWWNSPQNQRVS